MGTSFTRIQSIQIFNSSSCRMIELHNNTHPNPNSNSNQAFDILLQAHQQTMLFPSLPDLPPLFSFLCIVSVLITYIICCYLLIDFISKHGGGGEGEEEEEYTGYDRESSAAANYSSYARFSVEDLQEITCLYGKVGSNCSICVICLENLERAQVCRIMPDCRHEFHARCIDPWLSKRLTCPTCRAPFRFRQSICG